jgi:predicted NAD/FAD-dependent oxidoreductase
MAYEAPEKTSIAVIGAGVCGLACANLLKSEGYSPTIIEKSRGIGGRMATRRADDGIAFDHGAQYVTARNPDFKALMAEAIRDGSADYWYPSLSDPNTSPSEDWMVGLPGMSGFVKPLANGIDIRLSADVTGVDRVSSFWCIRTQKNPNGEIFERVVVTAPAPQARTLLASEPSIGSELDRVSIEPCLALMVAFNESLRVKFDAQRWDSGDLAWVARNSSKPKRDNAGDCWVVHASPAWSARNLELERDEIAQKLLSLFESTLGIDLPSIRHTSGHKWRYALTTSPLGKPFLASNDKSLFVGGDWCLGARVEYAFESGQAIAAAVIDSLASQNKS